MRFSDDILIMRHRTKNILIIIHWEKFMKDYCKILGFVVFAEILCLFINLSLAFSSALLFRIITAVCTVGILIGLMAQAGYSIARADKKLQKQNPDAVKAAKPSILAMLAMFPFQLCWIFLLLAKFGSIDGEFYRFYKLLCAPFLQICNLISADVYAQSIPIWGMVILQLLCWVPFFSVCTAYRMTLRGKSVDDMMYQ